MRTAAIILQATCRSAVYDTIQGGKKSRSGGEGSSELTRKSSDVNSLSSKFNEDFDFVRRSNRHQSKLSYGSVRSASQCNSETDKDEERDDDLSSDTGDREDAAVRSSTSSVKNVSSTVSFGSVGGTITPTGKNSPKVAGAPSKNSNNHNNSSGALSLSGVINEDGTTTAPAADSPQKIMILSPNARMALSGTATQHQAATAAIANSHGNHDDDDGDAQEEGATSRNSSRRVSFEDTHTGHNNNNSNDNNVSGGLRAAGSTSSKVSFNSDENVAPNIAGSHSSTSSSSSSSNNNNNNNNRDYVSIPRRGRPLSGGGAGGDVPSPSPVPAAAMKTPPFPAPSAGPMFGMGTMDACEYCEQTKQAAAASIAAALTAAAAAAAAAAKNSTNIERVEAGVQTFVSVGTSEPLEALDASIQAERTFQSRVIATRLGTAAEDIAERSPQRGSQHQQQQQKRSPRLDNNSNKPALVVHYTPDPKAPTVPRGSRPDYPFLHAEFRRAA